MTAEKATKNGILRALAEITDIEFTVMENTEIKQLYVTPLCGETEDRSPYNLINNRLKQFIAIQGFFSVSAEGFEYSAEDGHFIDSIPALVLGYSWD